MNEILGWIAIIIALAGMFGMAVALFTASPSLFIVGSITVVFGLIVGLLGLD